MEVRGYEGEIEEESKEVREGEKQAERERDQYDTLDVLL